MRRRERSGRSANKHHAPPPAPGLFDSLVRSSSPSRTPPEDSKAAALFPDGPTPLALRCIRITTCCPQNLRPPLPDCVHPKNNHRCRQACAASPHSRRPGSWNRWRSRVLLLHRPKSRARMQAACSFLLGGFYQLFPFAADGSASHSCWIDRLPLSTWDSFHRLARVLCRVCYSCYFRTVDHALTLHRTEALLLL
jgi:hypothetical protein